MIGFFDGFWRLRRGVIFGFVLTVFAMIQIVAGVLVMSTPCEVRSFGSDLRLRYGESLCAHQRVNSFRVWNHETVLTGFKPFPRPDMATIPRERGEEMVHAYPPWHVALFYFYGWLPWPVCLALMAAVFGACFCFIVMETIEIVRSHFIQVEFVSVMAISMIAFYATECFYVMNYGVLILAMFLLMHRMLERNLNLLAGLCWTVMMIKPQVGLLFVWPLFWHKRHVAILTAVVACLVATGVASFLVHESMLDLLLQIPEIGRPYGMHLIVEKIIKPALGESAGLIWMALAFAAVGLVTFLLRKSSFLVGCVPVSLAITLWTYSQWHDRVILLVLMIALVGRMLGSRKINRWIVCGLSLCIAVIALRVFPLAQQCGFGWAEREWIFQIFQGLELIAQVVFVILFIMNEVKESGRKVAVAAMGQAFKEAGIHS